MSVKDVLNKNKHRSFCETEIRKLHSVDFQGAYTYFCTSIGTTAKTLKKYKPSLAFVALSHPYKQNNERSEQVLFFLRQNLSSVM